MIIHHKTPEQAYQEREKRILDAMALKKPDRVPVLALFGSFPVMSSAGSMDNAKPENMKTMIDFTKEYGVY
jgi:hypothetical protein